MRRLLFLLALFLLATVSSVHKSVAAAERPNVLFIAVDDLRPQLNCYGNEFMHTPNMDRLAAQGTLFRRHYVQVPTCGASRYALLTGRRPNVGERWSNGAFRKLKRKRTAQPQTFPEFFRRNGYTTVSIGKISHQPDGHIYNYNGTGSGKVEVPFAWDDVGAPYGKWKYGWGAFFGYANGLHRANYDGASPVEAAKVDDDGYPDGLIAESAVKKLQRLSRQDEPFLLAVGFYKPHLPFTAPKRYWDLYERDKIPLSPNPERPTGINPASWHRSGECFGARYNSGNWPRNEKTARLLRHGYFAAVSYVDAQVGKLLDAVQRLQLADNTIVVLWGDHGWHLGDHAMWGKHTNFERAARSALIIRVPGMSQRGRNNETDALVETVDLYPTLLDVCGYTVPEHLAGASLRPVIKNPQHPGKDAAFTYWRGGTSMRTERYRIVSYRKGTPRVELYDHKTDPHETRNVAEKQPKIVKRLLSQLNTNQPSLTIRNR